MKAPRGGYVSKPRQSHLLLAFLFPSWVLYVASYHFFIQARRTYNSLWHKIPSAKTFLLWVNLWKYALPFSENLPYLQRCISVELWAEYGCALHHTPSKCSLRTLFLLLSGSVQFLLQNLGSNTTISNARLAFTVRQRPLEINFCFLQR